MRRLSWSCHSPTRRLSEFQLSVQESEHGHFFPTLKRFLRVSTNSRRCLGNRLVGAGGTSKFNRVVHSDIVNKKAVEAIRAVSKKPHGIFCVDLKEDVKDVPCPTEINCRFTTNVHYLSLASIKLGHPEWNFPWLAARLALEEEIPDCAKTNALPDDLWFTKNTDMGFTMVQGNH